MHLSKGPDNSTVFPDLMYDNSIMQDLHCFHDEWCSFKIANLEMKSENMSIQFYNLEIIRERQLSFEKDLEIKGVGKLKIKFM